MPDTPGGSPPTESAHGTGMLQYLQSWFPGWGGWYGYAQQTYEGEPFEGLLPDPKEQWNPEEILGMEIQSFLFVFKAAIVGYLVKVNRNNSLVLHCSKVVCHLVYLGSRACLKLGSLSRQSQCLVYLLILKGIYAYIGFHYNLWQRALGKGQVACCGWV